MAAEPGEQRPTISTHVLDTERGVPAAGVRHVLVHGVGVVRDGAFVEGVTPGRAVQHAR